MLHALVAALLVSTFPTHNSNGLTLERVALPTPETPGVVVFDNARPCGLCRQALRFPSSLTRERILLEKLVEVEEGVHLRHNSDELL